MPMMSASATAASLAGRVGVRHLFGATIRSKRARNHRIQCTANLPKLMCHWKQQQRLFAHQTKTRTDMTSHEMASLQTKLLREASSLTRVLYRKCMQSIKVIAGGNECDEDDFAARESEELSQFDGTGTVNFDRISMAPPVNRRNELASRANYYKSFARENFDGHWNLLGAHGFHIGDEGNMRHGLGHLSQLGGGQESNPGGQMSAQHQGGGESSSVQHNGEERNDAVYYLWREEQIEQFVYLIKSGEEKRQWILSDYEFEDPCNSPKDDTGGQNAVRGWSRELEDRLMDFEAQSDLLVKEMYRRKGWLHSSVYEDPPDEDDFFSDEESNDDL